MTDVTQSMLRYRECARNLYNTYFQKPLADFSHEGLDRWERINTMLFEHLVLDPLDVDDGGRPGWGAASVPPGRAGE